MLFLDVVALVILGGLEGGMGVVSAGDLVGKMGVVWRVVWGWSWLWFLHVFWWVIWGPSRGWSWMGLGYGFCTWSGG